MKPRKLTNKRIKEITELLLAVASGDFDRRGEVSENWDEYDAVVAGINMLSEELQASTVSRDYLESIYRGIPDLVFVVNSDHIIDKVNPAVSKIIGRTEQAIVGFNINSCFNKNSHNKLKYMFAILEEQVAIENIELELKTNKGDVVPVSVSGSVLYDKQQTSKGYIFVAKDITEIKEAQRELKYKNETLNTFVYKASHDLRGPLASIMGLVDVAKQESDVKEKEKYIDLIGKSTERLNSVLSDLMQFTMISYGAINIQKFSFKNLINQIIESLDHVNGYGKIEKRIHVNQRDEFKSDPKLVRSIIQNLVENAHNYHKENGNDRYVDIKVDETLKGVEIVVSDNGSGIKKEIQEDIFKMFYRGASNSNGSGLGLFILKNSVERLKGRVKVESELGKGSSFSVFLPNLG